MTQIALRCAAIAVWAVAIACWFPLAHIEGQTLSQPDHPTAIYSRPMHLKGVTRYVTPDQERWDSLATVGFVGGIFGFAALAFALRRFDKRKQPTSGKSV
jgi:hypothetical protein